jgi:hypothetical protein
MKHEIMFLFGLISLSSGGFCQNALSSARRNPREVKTRADQVIPFPLQSADLVLKLIDSISTASASGPVSSFIYAQVLDPVYDASGRAVIPSGKIIKLRYTVTPGKSFHRQRAELLFHLEPVEIEFAGRADPRGWTSGIWQIRLSGALHAVTVRGSGMPIPTNGTEGQIAARQATSPPPQGPPVLGTALGGIEVLPGGFLIHGLASAGESVGRLAFGKKGVYLPEGSTLHFKLSSTADAHYLGRGSTVRAVP